MSFLSSKRTHEDTFDLESDLESFDFPNHFESAQSADERYDSPDNNPTHFPHGLDLHSNISKSYGDHYMNGNTPSMTHNAVDPDQYQRHSSGPQNTLQTYTSTGFVDVDGNLGHLHPGATTFNSESLSPSSLSIVNHLSPAAAAAAAASGGYNSDHAHSEISEHTTPSFDEEPLNVDFGLVSSLDEDQVPAQEFSNVVLSSQVEEKDARSTSSLAHHHNGMPTHDHTTTTSYLLSPVTSTIESSPMNERNISAHSINSTTLSNVTSAPYNHSPIHTSSATAVMEQTPALTGSSKSSSHEGHNSNMRHLGSPIVMVENYSREESPSREQLSRSFSRRSRGSQLSAAHLSPNVNDGGYAEEHYEDERPDDRSGISPAVRSQLNTVEIPTLQEQEEQRHIAEKNVEIAQWLSTSEAGSDRGDPPSPKTLGIGLTAKPADRRRAKSVGDPRFMSNVALPDDSAIPGPGLLLDVDSGSEDEDEDEDSYSYADSPPAKVDEDYTKSEDPFPTVNEEPHPSQFRHTIRPWADPKIDTYEPRNRPEQIQPPTANAAMMWYNRRAGDVETSSRVATWGTRRLSETDVDKFIKEGGILKRLSFGKEKAKNKPERRTSGFFNTLLQRAPSNKRRHSEKNALAQFPQTASPERKRKDSGSNLLTPSRTSSFPTRRSPKNSTIGAVAAMTEQMTAIASHTVSATTTTAPTGPWERGKQMIKRSRSKSDLVRSTSPEGLKGLWTRAGGPPVANLATGPIDLPASQDQRPAFTMQEPVDEDDEKEDELMDQGIRMELNVTTEQIIPTFQGFLTHTQQLNPRLKPFLADRISHEQVGRYKRLSKSKIAHLNAIKSGQCSSTSKFCSGLGGKATIIHSKAAQPDSETAFVGFQVANSGMSDDEDDSYGEGAVAPAQFPQGVPLPPTKRLPAEFECTICYTVKKFQKPSDWTKHVHEDVQPFTCTWPNCTESKSFKRKADWVRHENEKHRKLEWWTCNRPECSHTCYRKDNFVQHLIREHKFPEPKLKSTKASTKPTGTRKGKSARDVEANDSSEGGPDQIWKLVEQCHHETPKSPQDEPCKFCGNICSSWKKLTVHLARHMEQISLPMLKLVEDRHVTVDTIISPVNYPVPQTQSLSPMTPAVAPKMESFESPYASNHGNQSYTSLHQISQHMPPQESPHLGQFTNPPAQQHYSSVSPLPNAYEYSQGQMQQSMNSYVDPHPEYSPSGYGAYQDSSNRGFVPVNPSSGAYNEIPSSQVYAAPLGTHGSMPNVSAYSSSSIAAGPFHQTNAYPVPSGGPGYGFSSNPSVGPGQHAEFPLEAPQGMIFPQGQADSSSGYQAPTQHRYN